MEETIKTENVFPDPDTIYNAFNHIDINNLKVVILGQDPYFRPGQAMGLSFSVPDKIKVPPSLINIYENLVKFGHMNTIPKHGNLTKWAEQGCLLLNSSLTVIEGLPNSHEVMWKPITDAIIKYISENTNNVVFFLWGGPSIKKLGLIDVTKHKVSISSHPSPLSYKNSVGKYGSFCQTDHFTVANEYLKEHGKEPINWFL